MAGERTGPKPAGDPDAKAQESAATRGLREQPAGDDPDAVHQTLGVVELERMVKDDGRALLVFRRADGR
jgi:hypothetical protein